MGFFFGWLAGFGLFFCLFHWLVLGVFWGGVGEGYLYCILQVYELFMSPFRVKDTCSKCLLIILIVLNHAYECFQFCRVNGLQNQ